MIDGATVESMAATAINEAGSGYGGGFFWGPSNSDGDQVFSGQGAAGPFGVSSGTAGFPSNTFGFQVVCGNAKTCTASAQLNIRQTQLTVGETVNPSISSAGLWDASGWVRGTWPITVTGDSPSGVCAYSASISGDPVAASSSYAANQTTWHQCASGGLSSNLNTTLAPNGANTLNVSDSDAAGLGNGASETLRVDNVAPTVSLSGPSDALSTAGTQEIRVNVNTGPSGAYGADCSIDGGAPSFYPGATSQVPVSGLGPHTVACTGQSNAASSTGQRATSTAAAFSIDIQQPTIEGITFSHLADALKCRTERRTVAIRGRRYVIHRHGRRIVVYSRTRHVKRVVRRCHARTVRRKVLVALRRHGKVVRRHGHVVRVRRVKRVVVLPHRVDRTKRRIRHGRGTTVSGFLGLSDGTALGGQTVTILGAANDGHPQFAPVSAATTNADGIWVAKIPAGPSRLLAAVYGGTATTAGATSTTVKLVVPAKIRLAISPRILPWRHRITIAGRMRGGHVPRDGVALRFLVRYPHSPQRSTLLALRTDRRGRFRFTWSYHSGRGVAHYPFSVATTAAETDYPFASGSSRVIRVTFGRRTPHRHRHRHRHRHHHRRHRHHRGHRRR